MASSLGERKQFNIDPYSWTHPSGNYLTACGSIIYLLDGSPSSYVAVTTSGTITVYSTTASDVSPVAHSNKIKAYPTNMSSAVNL
jgi:hypothetical protein